MTWITKFLITVIMALALLTGCSKSELKRETAANLIQSSPELAKQKEFVLLHKDALSLGDSLGWWTNPMPGFLPDTTNNTPKAFIRFASSLKEELKPRGDRIKLDSPANIKIIVTGITHDSEKNSAIAIFDWRYSELSSPTSAVATEGGSGIATFRMFDDGWRLISFSELSSNFLPYKMTTEDADAINNELAAIKSKREETIAAKARERSESAAKLEELFIGIWKISPTYECAYMTDKTFECRKTNGDMESGNWSIQDNQLTLHYTKAIVSGKTTSMFSQGRYRILEINSEKYSIRGNNGQFSAERIN